MVTFGDFVFVKGEKKERVDETTKEKKTFCSVTVECVYDEDVLTMSCEPAVFDKLKKYTKYHFAISKRSSVWNGEVKVRECVIDVKPI